jgi:transcriptional regulator with XRE-family HTH domain
MGVMVEMIGRRLRRARAERGITQVELAARTGVAHSTIVRIERGQARPKIETLGRFAEALGVDPKWLAFGDGPERTER